MEASDGFNKMNFIYLAKVVVLAITADCLISTAMISPEYLI